MKRKERRTLRIFIGISLGLFLIPIILYFCFNGIGKESDVEKLGPFGDFLGGLLNPLIGLANLCFLYYITVLVKRSDKRQSKKERRTQRELVLNQYRDNLISESRTIFHQMGEAVSKEGDAHKLISEFEQLTSKFESLSNSYSSLFYKALDEKFEIVSDRIEMLQNFMNKAYDEELEKKEKSVTDSLEDIIFETNHLFGYLGFESLYDTFLDSTEDLLDSCQTYVINELS